LLIVISSLSTFFLQFPRHNGCWSLATFLTATSHVNCKHLQFQEEGTLCHEGKTEMGYQSWYPF
jgi:hypothetical protein